MGVSNWRLTDKTIGARRHRHYPGKSPDAARAVQAARLTNDVLEREHGRAGVPASAG
jgi:hypothetical protein